MGYDLPDDGGLSPQYVIQRLGAIAGPESIYTSGVGQHQMWASHFVSYEHPNTWINSGGLGTMGFGVPAAMGAKVGRPDTTVWCIDGDGCFQMTNQELATCTIEGIPIKVAVINNESLGHGAPVADAVLRGPLLQHRPAHRSQQALPDFVKLADAYGAVGLSCDSPEDVDATITKAMEINDVPGGRGLPRAPRRDGLADGRRRHLQRRDQVRPRPRARLQGGRSVINTPRECGLPPLRSSRPPFRGDPV